MSNQIVVSVRATVHPTEDPKKVEHAIGNLFGALSIQSRSLGPEEFMLTAKSHGHEALSRLRELLRQDRIRDAARAELLADVSEWGIRFFINKQVAYVGHVSLSSETGESPLGPIEVEVNCKDPLALVHWLAPSSTS